MRTTLRPERKGFRKYRSAPNTNRATNTLQAASLAWEAQPRLTSASSSRPESDPSIEARLSATAARRSIDQDAAARNEERRKSGPSAADAASLYSWRDAPYVSSSRSSMQKSMESLQMAETKSNATVPNLIDLEPDVSDLPPPVPPHILEPTPTLPRMGAKSPSQVPKAPQISYRNEYPTPQSRVPPALASNILNKAYQKNDKAGSSISRKPVANSGATLEVRGRRSPSRSQISDSEEETPKVTVTKPRRPKAGRTESTKTITPPSTDAESVEDNPTVASEKRMAKVLKDLPKGLDANAAKQILNEIVVKGDEVHWEDVAGLEGAKKALKEAVVYPFLRPDLFMGLREPARGMLLFGPPGTGKTMLARAVATESKSTFFAISASSLTSKWHGESEKLVRALFALAKALAPSIIFVDEIDSLLSARSGSSEHEASRRSKTEFLIQWSDLQRAAAGKDTTIGDASRVLVLAATNCPWDIDEAARRRFVRRQYIPLPEVETRDTQIRTLLGHQKHDLSEEDIGRLVGMTDGEFAVMQLLVGHEKGLMQLCRIFGVRHNGVGQGRRHGTTAALGRSSVVHTDGPNPADLHGGFRGQS